MKPTIAKITIALTLTGALLGTAAFAAQHKEGGEKRQPRAERMFEKMDTDTDGKVTLDEAKAFAADRFAKRDLDGDGVVTRADRQAKRIERRTERFAKIDADADGMISVEEFTAYKPERGERRGQRRSGHRMGGHHGERHGHRGGKGNRRMGRGPLTIQEVEARATQRFERMDTDAKGYITLEDVKAMHEKRGGRHGRK